MTALATRLPGTSERRARHVALIAHGSPDPRHRASIRRLALRLATGTGDDVHPGFLEHDSPSAVDAIAEAGGAATSVVLPLLLTAGYHWHSDVPAVTAHQGSRCTLLPPPAPALFTNCIDGLVGEAPHVVLASAGSTRPEIVSRFALLADALTTPHRTVDVCLTLDSLEQTATSHSTVVPVLTADGVFADRVRRAASRSGSAVTPVLGDTPEFARVLCGVLLGVD